MFNQASKPDLQRATRIIGLRETSARTNCSRSKIYRLMHAGLFPAQAKKLANSRTAGWFEDEIEEWLSAQRANPIRPIEIQRNESQNSDPQLLAQQSTPQHQLRLHTPNRKESKPAAGVPAPSELQLTNMIIFGHSVYIQLSSGKLLMDIGKLDSIKMS